MATVAGNETPATPPGPGLISSAVSSVQEAGSGLFAGAKSAGLGVIDNAVGGAANRALIQGAAGKVYDGAADILSGKTSIGGMFSSAPGDSGGGFISSAASSLSEAGSGLFAGAQRAGLSAIDGFVGGTANRELIQKAAGNVYDGAADILSGKKSIGGMFSSEPETKYTAVAGSPTDYTDVNGMCMGPEGGTDLTNPDVNMATVIAGNEGSQWGGLSPHLIGRIYACDADGLPLIGPIDGQPDRLYEPLGVSGPCTEMNLESTLNWQSPFENIGPESMRPTLMAMLQSGSLVPVLNAVQASDLIPEGATKDVLNGAAEKLKKIAKELEGRTGITKMNSRQVFAGMPPIKLTLTMHFRAFADAQAEVMEPYQRLLEFSMPQGLAADGVLTEVIAATSSENSSFLKAMFPSIAPLMVGFTYANTRFPAMVVEGISNTLDGPMDKNGRPIYRAVQIVLATLTACDRADIKKFFV